MTLVRVQNTYMIEPGWRVARGEYVRYLRGCSEDWAALGEREQAERVAAKASSVEREEDDVSLATTRPT